MTDIYDKPYRKKVVFTGNVRIRKTLLGKTVVTIEELHTVLSGWAPGLSGGTPARSKGDTWTTWRDATMEDYFKMGEQIRGDNT